MASRSQTWKVSAAVAREVLAAAEGVGARDGEILEDEAEKIAAGVDRGDDDAAVDRREDAQQARRGEQRHGQAKARAHREPRAYAGQADEADDADDEVHVHTEPVLRELRVRDELDDGAHRGVGHGVRAGEKVQAVDRVRREDD